MRTWKIGLAIGVLLFAGLASAALTPPETVPDSKIAPPAASCRERPQRIVSLAPGTTEILFALGAGDRVAGVTDWCNWPPAAREKPKVGGFSDANAERVLILKPDLVFTAGEIHRTIGAALRQAGIRVVDVAPQTLDEVPEAVRKVAAAIGEPAAGERLVRELAAKAARLAEMRRAAAGPPPRVFVEIWDKPFLTVGRQSFINDVIERAGGINAAGALRRGYAPTDAESLLAMQPDIYVIVNHTGSEKRYSRVASGEIAWGVPAIKKGNLFYLDGDLVTRPGPRSFDAALALADMIAAVAGEAGGARR